MASGNKQPTGRILTEAEFSAGLDWVDPGTIAGGNTDDGGDSDGSVSRSNGAGDTARTAAEFTGGTNKDGSPTRKRGRKPGSGSGPGRKASSSKDVHLAEVIASSIVTVSALASKHFEAPEWDFDKDEADAIGKAAQTVTELYADVKLPAEVIAWGNLAMVLAGAIGPRMYMTTERLRAKRAKDVTPRPSVPAPVQPATPEFVVPAAPPMPDTRPQAPSPPTGVELNKSLFPDEFKF